MKYKKVFLCTLPFLAIPSTVLPLFISTAVKQDLSNCLNNAELNSFRKDIYKISKIIKDGSAIFQNAWIMNDTIAKRQTNEKIYANAFAGNKDLQYVAYSNDSTKGTSKSDIKTIETGAFQGCSNLQYVKIPGTDLTTNDTYTIGPRAFFRCENLTTLDFTAFGSNSTNLHN